MDIFLVIEYDDAHECARGIFSTIEAARNYCRNTRSGLGYWDIERFAVDGEEGGRHVETLKGRTILDDLREGKVPPPPSPFPANREIREGDTPTRTTD